MADEIDDLIAALDSPDEGQRLQVAQALGETGDARAVAPLIRVLRDKGTLRSTAATSLHNLGRLALPTLLVVVADPAETKNVRLWTISTLGETGDQSAVAPLIGALGDTDSDIRYAAAQVLGRLGDPSAMTALTDATNDSDGAVRYAAGVALQHLGSNR